MITIPLRVCIVGLGHWGPNFLNAINSHPQAIVVAGVDLSTTRRDLVSQRLPTLALFSTLREAISSVEIDAVVISVPTAAHYEVTLEALKAGKHVFVEKPLAHSYAAGSHLVMAAQEARKVLMCGHIFLFNHAILNAKELVETESLGKLSYMRSVRTNFGPIRQDVSSLWDLATHDISIFCFLFNEWPTHVSCSLFPVLGLAQQDLGQLALRFADGRCAFSFFSWLDPQKKRELTIVGEKKMLFFDDLNVTHPLRLFDKKVLVREPLPFVESFTSFHLAIQEGVSEFVPVVTSEPLKTECHHFIDAIISTKSPRSDGAFSLRVLQV